MKRFVFWNITVFLMLLLFMTDMLWSSRTYVTNNFTNICVGANGSNVSCEKQRSGGVNAYKDRVSWNIANLGLTTNFGKITNSPVSFKLSFPSNPHKSLYKFVPTQAVFNNNQPVDLLFVLISLRQPDQSIPQVVKNYIDKEAKKKYPNAQWMLKIYRKFNTEKQWVELIETVDESGLDYDSYVDLLNKQLVYINAKGVAEVFLPGKLKPEIVNICVIL